MKHDVTSLLEIRNLTVQRERFLLDNINLSIHESEIFSIIGKTGSGKTLLLEAVAAFYEPNKGEILYRGKRMRDIPIYDRNVGYLYQEYCLFPHMTAFSNIAYSLRVQGFSKSDITSTVHEMAERFDIEHILNQYPGTLSGGEQQRVALARALITQPPLLLLDEPFSALDPITKEHIYALIREIRRDFGCSVLFVTHNFAEAEHLADRIGVLINGHLCGIVKSNELYTSQWGREAQAFLGINQNTNTAEEST